MKSVLQWVFVALGLGLGGFAANVAIRGAEPAIPSADASIEGEVLPGETIESPVGAPFLYGEVSLQDSDNTQTSMGTIHWSGAFGNPRIRIRTASGERAATLPGPKRWRTLADAEESRQVASIEGVPIVGEVEIGDRLSPPFRLSVRAIRAGDHVIVAKDSSVRVPVYLGHRAELERARAAREAGRWPIVVVLGILAASSLFLATKLRRGSFLDSSDADVPS